MASRSKVSKEVLEVLRKHGIRFEVFRGEPAILYDDLKKFFKLCDEGKLPKSIC